MKNFRATLVGCLALCVFAASSQSAWAVNTIIDASTMSLGPTQVRDGGPGIPGWANTASTADYPNETTDFDTFSDYNVKSGNPGSEVFQPSPLLQPAVIVDNGNEL